MPFPLLLYAPILYAIILASQSVLISPVPFNLFRPTAILLILFIPSTAYSFTTLFPSVYHQPITYQVGLPFLSSFGPSKHQNPAYP